MAHLGHFEEGKHFLEKGLDNATQIGAPLTLGVAYFHYGHLFWVKGDWKSANEYLEKSLTYFEEAKFSIGVAVSLCRIGSVHSSLGDPETGKNQTEKGLQMYRDSGNELYLSLCYWIMGSMHLDLGDLGSAETSLEEGLRLSRKNKEKISEGLALIGLGRVLGKKEPQQPKKAEECFSQGLAILQDQKTKPWYAQGRMFLGEFYLDGGAQEKALENLKEAEEMFKEMGMDYWLNRTKEVLGRLG